MADLRRDVQLPGHDVAFLDCQGLDWETILEGNIAWLAFYGYDVPAGYNHKKVAVALQLPPSYPDAQIDMVYFLPHLALVDGRPIRALNGQSLQGKNWQRWSRHRTGTNPWRPGLDNVETHMLLVKEWLCRELEKAA